MLSYSKHELVYIGKFFRKLRLNLLSAYIILFLFLETHSKPFILF